MKGLEERTFDLDCIDAERPNEYDWNESDGDGETGEQFMDQFVRMMNCINMYGLSIKAEGGSLIVRDHKNAGEPIFFLDALLPLKRKGYMEVEYREWKRM